MAGTIGQGGNPEKRSPPPYLVGLKIAVGIMGALIVFGVAVLVLTMVQRLSGGGPRTEPVAVAPAPGFGEADVALPPGATIQDMSVDDRRLVLRLKLNDNNPALLVIDLGTGRRLGLIRLKPEVQ